MDISISMETTWDLAIFISLLCLFYFIFIYFFQLSFDMRAWDKEQTYSVCEAGEREVEGRKRYDVLEEERINKKSLFLRYALERCLS